MDIVPVKTSLQRLRREGRRILDYGQREGEFIKNIKNINSYRVFWE
jgi:hypothetical protein